MSLDLEQLGRWSDAVEFEVDADRTKAYAAATNDPTAAHRAGELAPPVFAVVPVWGVIGGQVAHVVPGEILNMVVHGEQDMVFHQPIRPGMVLRSRGMPFGVQVKPSGTTLTTKLETRDERGELVNEQYMTAFIRGLTDGESAGQAPPDHRFPETLRDADPVEEVVQTFDDDQTFRYAEASGDHMPIHLDDDLAKSVGLPGIIIHGLCTMAFTSHAVIGTVAGGDTTRLRRLAVRFSKPVLPGQQITTRIWRASDVDGRSVYAFETLGPEGASVIKDGLAEVAPA